MGCRDLLHALTSLPTFSPEATWLATVGHEPVGTIQCTYDPESAEAVIHNIGVVPARRRGGVGSALLSRCLSALSAVSCRALSLEVTATNEPALRLYRKFGFRPYKTVYLRAYGIVPSPGHGI